MKKETTKIQKPKKRIFGKYRTTIVLTSVLFLLFACAITFWAVNERKNIISDADAILQDRKEQSMGPNGYLDEIRQDLEKILGKDTKKEE